MNKEEFTEEKEEQFVIRPELTDPEIFKFYLVSKKLSESTIELYSDVVQHFIMLNPDLKEINSYNNFLLERTIKHKSGYYHYALRHYINWKITDFSLRKKILDNLITPKKEDPVYHTHYLTPGRRKKIISVMENVKHKIIANLQNQTGARVTDILRLKRGAITYENYKDKVVMKIDIIGKRGVRNAKWIFDEILQEDIIEYISTHKFDEEYYFIEFDRSQRSTSKNKVFRTNYIRYWRDIKKALKRIGLDPKVFSTHDWRRCIARDIYTHKDIGKDIQLLQQFLGHRRTDTTMKYLRHSGLSTIQISEKLANDKITS